jgi:hypothetical protein
VFAGLLVGAMLPYWFSAMTMKSVGKAALAMVEEVRRQFNTINGLMEGTARPDYSRCVKISTDSSLREMIPPGAWLFVTVTLIKVFLVVWVNNSRCWISTDSSLRKLVLLVACSVQAGRNFDGVAVALWNYERHLLQGQVSTVWSAAATSAAAQVPS